MKFIKIFVVLAILFPGACFAWSGMVVALVDGDTVKVLHDGRQEKIRLYGIDAPEKKQPFGMVAKDGMAKMVAGKTVEIEPVYIDFYGRTIAWVYVGKPSISVNEEMVLRGLAWHYKQYSKDASLKMAEGKARSEKLGLWVDTDPLAPWEFRKRK